MRIAGRLGVAAGVVAVLFAGTGVALADSAATGRGAKPRPSATTPLQTTPPPTPSASPSPSPTASASPSPSPTVTTPTPSGTGGAELVYVANVDGPVTAYPATTSGAVLPVRSLLDPHDPNTYWGPWGVAFDSARNAYVQSYLSDATTFVYAPGATLPGRIFRVDGPDSRAIVVDAAGYSYVATGQSGSVISVAAPGASGVPGNLYTVTPVRQLPTDESPFHPWPSILTKDSAGHIIAAVVRSGGNAIEYFTGGPGGSNTPVKVITGPDTGLGSCASTCDQLAVAYSASTGEVYVAVSQGQQTHVNVYAASASGDAAPVRVLAGSATGLVGQVITGLAASPVDGNLYVLAKSAEFGSAGTVLVFGRTASGNASPLRSFTDASTGLSGGMGIALASAS
jgi:hypothetical protein